MITARKANKTLGEHADAHEAVTRLGGNKKRPTVKPEWTIDNIHENLVGKGIVEYLKAQKTISMRDINTAANRLTKIAGADIKEGRARDYVARLVGYNDYNSIDITVRAAIPVRNDVQRRKANRTIHETRLEDDEPLVLTETTVISPLLMLALCKDVSKRHFRKLGKEYRTFVNKDERVYPLTLMQSYNHIARVLGYPDYHSMPRQYPILNLKYIND